jgi:hypothetical protein
MKSRIFSVGLLLIVLALIQSAVIQAKPNKNIVAFAEFEFDHGNDCTVTSASVYVYATEEDPSVDFHFDTLGQPTSPGCDQLWYIFMDGSAPLNSSEFSVSNNRKSASLSKTMQVWEDEAGTYINVTFTVEWTVTPGAGGGTTATMTAYYANTGFPLSGIEQLTTSDAGIKKLKAN